MMISIITICYNAAAYIEKTILSVIRQTYEQFEYIVVDGGSKDGTINVIEKYESNIDQWVSERDGGIYDAMNKGIRMAAGDWLIFMNAGDCFHNDEVLEDFVRLADEEHDIIYGSIIKVLPDIHYRYDPYPIEMMDKCMILPHQAAFVKTKFQKKHPFDISYRVSGDYHFFYNAYFKNGAKFKQIDLVVADFDETGGMSKDNIKTARIEDLRIWGKEHSFYPALRIKMRILYWRITCFIDGMLPERYSIMWRNYKLRRRGYKLILNQ